MKGGGHCNLETYPEYIRHLRKFINAMEKLSNDKASKASQVPPSSSMADVKQVLEIREEVSRHYRRLSTELTMSLPGHVHTCKRKQWREGSHQPSGRDSFISCIGDSDHAPLEIAMRQP